MIHEGIWTEYRPTYADHWSAVKRMGDLVRCKDCEHSSAKGSYCYQFMTIDTWENPVPSEVKPDGFCAWGVRRDA